MNDRFGERHRKIGVIGPCPSVCYAITGNQRIILYADIRPQDFSVVIVNTMNHIENNTLVSAITGKSIFMNSHPFGGRQLRFYAIIGQHDFVIAGTGYLRVVRETGTVTAVRIGRCSGIQFQAAGSGHDQYVPQVGMTGSAEMRMTETDDTAVLMLVSGTIFIGTGLILAIDIMRDRVGIRT